MAFQIDSKSRSQKIKENNVFVLGIIETMTQSQKF